MLFKLSDSKKTESVKNSWLPNLKPCPIVAECPTAIPKPKELKSDLEIPVDRAAKKLSRKLIHIDTKKLDCLDYGIGPVSLKVFEPLYLTPA